jgi:murein L,D-transpeptidase YafK
VFRKIIFLFVTAILAGAVGLGLYAHRNWNPLPKETTIDRIVLQKSIRKLSVFRDGRELKSYHVALGANPVGAKEEEGDMKTPEGIYRIDYRNPHSDYHLALHVSYPSEEDTARAAQKNVNAGFDIMIHGLPNGRGWMGAFHRRKDWTAGCVALTNEEIEELWRITPDGITLEMQP